MKKMLIGMVMKKILERIAFGNNHKEGEVDLIPKVTLAFNIKERTVEFRFEFLTFDYDKVWKI